MKIGLILDKLDYEPSGIGDYEYSTYWRGIQ